MAEETISLVGQTIADRYQVINELGSGGFAAVYVAKHLGLNNMVALKILHEHLSSDNINVLRFRREAEATCQLKHGAIATVYDFGQLTDGRPYMIMEYLQGQSLGSIIDAEAPLPASRIVPLILECCDALFYAHRRGLLHRDIKPDNIYVIRDMDGAEHVKLLDFGLAKLVYGDDQQLSKLTQRGHIVGTPWYMSPEQCLTVPLDGRSDLYSLACSLYQALSGKRPFAGKNVFDTMHAHVHQKPARINSNDGPPIILPSLEAVILRTLEKSPNDRFSTAAELKQALIGAMSMPNDSVAPARQPTLQATPAPLPPSAPSRAPVPSPASAISSAQVSSPAPAISSNHNKVKCQIAQSSLHGNKLRAAFVVALLVLGLGFAIFWHLSSTSKKAAPPESPQEATKSDSVDSAILNTVADPSHSAQSESGQTDLPEQLVPEKDFADTVASPAQTEDTTSNKQIEELKEKLDTLLTEKSQARTRTAQPQPDQSNRTGLDSTVTPAAIPSESASAGSTTMSNSEKSTISLPPSNALTAPNRGYFAPPSTNRAQIFFPPRPQPGEPGFRPPPGWRPGMPLPPPRGYPPPDGGAPGRGPGPDGGFGGDRTPDGNYQ